ncbi:Uncharacterised protein [Enterobacter hormaechei]|nr:Uncharacterised protein [Enterobacter hormaechei]
MTSIASDRSGYRQTVKSFTYLDIDMNINQWHSSQE